MPSARSQIAAAGTLPTVAMPDPPFSVPFPVGVIQFLVTEYAVARSSTILPYLWLYVLYRPVSHYVPHFSRCRPTPLVILYCLASAVRCRWRASRPVADSVYGAPLQCGDQADAGSSGVELTRTGSELVVN